MPQVKRPPRTVKEKAFAQEYLRTGNATEAASKVYQVKNRNSARNIGSQNVAKLSFSEFFQEVGLDDSYIATQLFEATQAHKISYDRDQPDWNVRLKALELVLRLKQEVASTQATDQAAIPQNQEEEDSWWEIFMRLAKHRSPEEVREAIKELETFT